MSAAPSVLIADESVIAWQRAEIEAANKKIDELLGEKERREADLQRTIDSLHGEVIDSMRLQRQRTGVSISAAAFFILLVGIGGQQL